MDEEDVEHSKLTQRQLGRLPSKASRVKKCEFLTVGRTDYFEIGAHS